MSGVSKSFTSQTINYHIREKQIEYDEHARIISVQWQEEEGIRRVNIPLTPTEQIIIKALLETSYQKVADLEQKIRAHRSLPASSQAENSSTTRKHMRNLRLKLQEARLTILRIVGLGYTLEDSDAL
jgi:hypothetical protein